jgi:hypothetical protein
MANTIILKRSAAANSVPGTGNLVLGELAINTADGRLFTKIDTGVASIVDLTKTDITGDATGNRVASTGNIALTLANTAVTPGTYGNATAIPSFAGCFWNRPKPSGRRCSILFSLNNKKTNCCFETTII